jgi:hypothetical protein
MGLEGCTEKVVFVDLSRLQRELYLAILALPDFRMLAQCRYVCVYSVVAACTTAQRIVTLVVHVVRVTCTIGGYAATVIAVCVVTAAQ